MIIKKDIYYPDPSIMTRREKRIVELFRKLNLPYQDILIGQACEYKKEQDKYPDLFAPLEEPDKNNIIHFPEK